MTEQVRYSMKEWKPPTMEEQIYEVERKLAKLEDDRQPIVDRKRELEISLSEYTATIKGGNFSTDQYIALCQQQNDTKKLKYDCDNELLAIKREMKKLQDERERLVHLKRKGSKERVEEFALELGDKYMGFSADTTRVSSMRAMAAKFSEELQTLLKYLDKDNK